MNLLRASVVATLGIATCLATAQGATLSVEERLQKLEAEQSAMKEQQAELQQQQAAHQQQLDLFKKGFAACLEPKGDTVE